MSTIRFIGEAPSVRAPKPPPPYVPPRCMYPICSMCELAAPAVVAGWIDTFSQPPRREILAISSVAEVIGSVGEMNTAEAIHNLAWAGSVGHDWLRTGTNSHDHYSTPVIRLAVD